MSSEPESESVTAPPTFDSLPLSAELRQAIDELGYTHPTPVQRAVFEPATRGRDLVVQARTGTGKTAAFGMPLIDGLIKKGTAEVQALILCPTRELALQVGRELEALGKHRGVKVAAIYGGAPMPKQIQQIKDGAQIVSGTPGRVLDHLRRKTLDPSHIQSFVLDESDEMLSMGFLPQITEIMGFLPGSRQTLLFSATLPPAISRMAETRLEDPEFITLSGDQVGALEIDHFVYLTRGDKIAELIQVIEIEDPESAIVFSNTRDDTKRVAAALQQQGFAADWLNADLAQGDREKVMVATRKGELRFLVATDVAARGIDISHLTHVINFDFPESTEAYVHRTGRTGRAGRTGTAISLITPSDIGNLYLMRLTYKIQPIEKQLPSQRELKTRAETDLVEMFAELFANKPTHPDDLALVRRLLTHTQAEKIVAGLLRDHLGARPDAAEEATAARRAKAPAPVPDHAEPGRPAERTRRRREAREDSATGEDGAHSEGSTRAERPRRSRRERTKVSEERAAERDTDVAAEQKTDAAAPEARSSARENSEHGTSGDVAEVYINVGRKDGAQASDFHTLLEQGGVTAGDTDYVHVRLRHSFVGVHRDALPRVLDALNGATIAGKQAVAEEARART